MLNASRMGGLNIRGVIADHQRTLKIEIQILGRTQQHAGLGFPVITGLAIGADTVLGMVWTMVNSINGGIVVRKATEHPPGQFSELSFAVDSSTNSSLIRHNNRPVSISPRLTDKFKNARDEVKVLDPMHMAMINIDHTITIKEMGGTWHGINGAGKRGGSEPASNPQGCQYQ
jgi:hypothetical protein